jgi:hypothetical protein
MKQIASTAGRRQRFLQGLKAATKAWMAPGLLLVLFLASLIYVAFGGALGAPSALETDTPITAAAPIDLGGATAGENTSGSWAEPTH